MVREVSWPLDDPTPPKFSSKAFVAATAMLLPASEHLFSRGSQDGY